MAVLATLTEKMVAVRGAIDGDCYHCYGNFCEACQLSFFRHFSIFCNCYLTMKKFLCATLY